MPDLTTHDIARCDYCGGRIRWATTQATGARQAINPDPDENGNLAVWRDGTGRLWARALAADRGSLEYAEWRGMPHAATCTNRPARRTTRRAPRHRRGVRPGPQWRQP